MSRRRESRATPPRVPQKRPGKPGSKRDANRREKVRLIATAALDLFLDSGIAAVTIDQIVDRAGVPKGSFYRYFSDKRELAESILAPLSERVGAAMARCAEGIESATGPGDMPAVYTRLAQELGAAVIGHPREVKLYLQECRAPAVGARAPVRKFADAVARQAIELSNVARDHGLLRDSDPRVGALTVVGAAEQLLFAYHNGVDLGPPERIPATLVSVILHGVLAPR